MEDKNSLWAPHDDRQMDHMAAVVAGVVREGVDGRIDLSIEVAAGGICGVVW